VVFISEILEKDAPFKHYKKLPVQKQVWVKKDKKVKKCDVKDPLLELQKCNLHKLISILQKFASDPSVNSNQAGFGSYIANHALKEKIAMYNQEAMILIHLKRIYNF
jgi:hypothetical protein